MCQLLNCHAAVGYKVAPVCGETGHGTVTCKYLMVLHVFVQFQQFQQVQQLQQFQHFQKSL